MLAEYVSNTDADDLLVTFIHRPPKTEPKSYDHDSIEYLPQMDGQVDDLSTKTKNEQEQKDLDSVIAKVKANTSVPNRTIQLNKIPTLTNKFRLNDDMKKNSMNKCAKKSFSIPTIIKRKSEQSKQIKKLKSRLLSSVLKNNQDAIRPLNTRISSRDTTIQVIIYTIIQ